MPLDKYSQLKIAGNVLGFSMKEFADEIDATPQVVKRVCEGRDTSARIIDIVDSKIAESERVFDQHRRAKLQAESN